MKGIALDPNDSVLTRLFTIAKQGKARLVVSCLLMALGTLAGMVPYLSVYFIARAVLFPEAVDDMQGVVVFWSLLALGSIVVNMICSFTGSYGAHVVAFRVLYGIRVRIMEHIGRLSLGFFGRHTTGSVQKTMDDSISKIEIFIAHLLPDFVGSICAVSALLIGLGSLNIWLALAVVAAVAFACFLQLRIWGGNRGQSILVGLASLSGKMTGAFSEYVQGIAEVKLFGLTGTVTRALNETTREYSEWEMKLYKRVNPFYEAYKTIILSLMAVVMPVGTLLIWLNPGDPGVMVALLMGLIVTPAICTPFLELVSYGTQMGEITVALSTIDSILKNEPIPSGPNPKSPESFDIAFHDVSFSYQEASDPLRSNVLDSMSFVAPQNRMTALVGPSGSGKSTIGQLISRFWDVDSGQIAIGGIDIRDMDFGELMDRVSFVFQDTYIFADTVRGNLSMNREVPEEKIIEAARLAQCHDFIMQFPEGYETRIGGGGIGLSGGEAQRIAIARAILKDAPIIILDEALAYSDAENENLIQKAIDKLIEDKTVIIIAHRLPSIQKADHILFLEKGTIVEQGTHEALMSHGSRYRELWDIQSEADGWSIEFGVPVSPAHEIRETTR